MSTSSSFVSIVRPAPLQTVHGVSTICPAPAHVGHVCVRTNSPKTLRETCCSLAAAAARGAGDALGPRLGTVAVAALAGDGHLDLDGALHARERVGELDPDRDADVAAPRPAAAAAREQVVAEEGGEDVGQVREVEVGRRVAAAPQSGVPVAVVELPRLGLREHLVRLGDGAEALLRVRLLRDVRMQLARELAERALDLGVAGAALDAEQLVVVAFRRGHGHQA